MNNSLSHAVYAFPPSPVNRLAIAGWDQLFPIRRVYCVGRNYAAHAMEMGHDPERDTPFFFQKNPDNLLIGADFPYPPLSQDVHYEVEFFVALQDGGCNLSLEKAEQAVFGYGVGVDFTRRDLQAIAKEKGRPWLAAKAFEHSAPVSHVVRSDDTGALDGNRIWLEKNGTIQQDSNLDHLIWSVPEVIVELSKQMQLAAGDIIFTGTPAGVGPVQIGDKIKCGVENIATLSFSVVD